MQIDLVCAECKAEMRTRVVRKGVLDCTCPNCKYRFRMTISGADEMESSL
jgi:Zn finger protein HypA/HybF involved in hydrogenase expression